MSDAPQADSYDAVCFRILAYEFPGDDLADANNKIKRKLKRSRLGPHDQERVDHVRALKDELYAEIRLFRQSQYYVGPIGSMADLGDFDFERMVDDYGAKFNRLSEGDLRAMIGFALFLYYLR